MNRTIIYILSGFVALMLLAIVIPLTSYFSAYNTGNTLEVRLVSQYKDNQNKLSSMSNSVMEMIQVSEIAKDQIREIIKEGIQGRFGPNGSSAIVQAFSEKYPGAYDPSLLRRVSTTILTKRNEFEIHQRKLLDVCATYDLNLNSLWTGTFMRMAGYPKLAGLTEIVGDGSTKKAKVCQPVVSGYAQETFSTGVDKGMQLKRN
jgi:hypothetical protein